PVFLHDALPTASRRLLRGGAARAAGLGGAGSLAAGARRRRVLGVLADQLDEGADTDARGALALVVALAVVGSRTGDVEVRPGRLPHELLEDHGRAARAAVAVAGVAHVGDVRLQGLLEVGVQRQ